MLHLHSPLSEVYREEGFAIFIGSAANAANPKALAEAGIKYVLNVSDRIRFRRVDGPPISLYHVPLSDFGDTPLSSVLDECFTTINEARENHGNILVHCQGGVNRSPTVVIAYLMSIGWTLKKAWEQVKEKRPMASPHERYMQQLIEYEIELYGNATLDFAEYEQNSLQANLRKIRQQIATETTNHASPTNVEITTSTNVTNSSHTTTNNAQITNATSSNAQVTQNTPNSSSQTINATITTTNVTTTNAQTTISTSTTTNNNSESQPPDKKKETKIQKFHFHNNTNQIHMPQLNLECMT